jgi:carboxylesterase type B
VRRLGLGQDCGHRVDAGNLAFLPVIDEATLPADPMATLADSDVDLIIGWTSDEAAFAFGFDPPYKTTTREQVIAWASGRYADAAAALYAPTQRRLPARSRSMS